MQSVTPHASPARPTMMPQDAPSVSAWVEQIADTLEWQVGRLVEVHPDSPQLFRQVAEYVAEMERAVGVRA